jgi:2-C-methyl-D-erythritol 4-phosphate cytidylyltransferase
MQINAVIVAAGDGTRMGVDVPKPLLNLAGRPMILHTLGRFAVSETRRVILVTAAEQQSKFERIVQADRALSALNCVFQSGGPRRQDSVREGLKRVDDDCEIVIVHDAARPFVSPLLIDRCVAAARTEGAVVVGIPVKDTIKIVSSSRRIESTPPRDSLWEIQTPQAFRVELLREAHLSAERDGIEATDDAILVERLGKSVVLLEGDRSNIKITTPEDLLLAEALIRERRVL